MTMTDKELPTHVSQAAFGRLVGLSAMRISQLARAGLIIVDVAGVRLAESLRRFYGYQFQGKCYGGSLEDYVRHLEDSGDDSD